MKRTVVEARAITRRYGARIAVRPLDLRVPESETVGIVGPDGAGKTTLLQMLAGILDPSGGECRVLGLDTRRAGKRIARHIGYMSQGFSLYDRLSVDENLTFAARIRGVRRADFAGRRARLLAMAGLEPFAARLAGRLSGGMRKKLALCCNLIHEPPLLLLDEPGLGVDPLSRRELWRMLGEFRRRGVAAVVATSYMDEAEQCDRVVLLHEGEVVASDTPAAVRAQVAGRVFELEAALFESLADERLRELPLLGVQMLPGWVRLQVNGGEGAVRRLLAALPPGTALEAAPPTLEDVFVRHADAQGVPAPVAAAPPMRVASARAGVEVRGLTVRFGAFVAVNGVDLEVRPGELLALLGPNGAGKTTLIRTLCGLARVASGTATVAGHALSRAVAIRRSIGYMSQRFSLYADLTPEENLGFFAGAYGLAGAGAREAIEWARRMTGLGDIAERPVRTLSGALRQRLALACSILHAPQVLFLDEPTSGVDPLSRYRFWRLIRTLARAGMTVIVTTHYLDEAAYCDRVALMDSGRLIAAGALPELRSAFALAAQASVEEVFIAAIESAGRRGGSAVA